MSKGSEQDYQVETVAVQSGLNQDKNHNSIVAPLYLASNYKFESHINKPVYEYSRGGNPTRDTLGQALAELEGGAGGVITSSGMSAINLILQLLKPTDTLVAPLDCYGGSFRLFESLAKRGAFTLVWLDYYADDFEQKLAEAKPNLIWVESPSNPLLRVTNIRRLAELKAQWNAKIVADNTFLSPIAQRPLDLGADFVVHSCSKYINGHSDVVSGAVICADEDVHQELVWWANNTGVTAAPFDTYMVLRSLRTLPLRIRQHSVNAQAIAELLESHDQVTQVNYPGLPNHPDYELAKEQHKFNAGMLSFELAGGAEQVTRFVNSLTLFTLAESLGGTESLVCVPATMTHAAMPIEAQEAAGIKIDLVRFSVGVEDTDDLIADVVQALEASKA